MEKSDNQVAIDFYKSHLENMKKYYGKNREVINERAKNYYKSIKADPEKYKNYLEQKRKRWKEKHPKENPPVI